MFCVTNMAGAEHFLMLRFRLQRPSALVGGRGGMSRSNPLLWPKPPAIWRYGIAVLAVAVALIISRWPVLHLQEAPVSLFLCAVMFSAWFGGVGPGLLGTCFSTVAF